MNKNWILAFGGKLALQRYLPAEEAILVAIKNDANYWYLDGSLPSEHPENWSVERISHIVRQVQETGCRPIFHSNFKASIGSDIKEVRRAAVEYIRSEIDVSSQLGCDIIVHGGSVVEPRNPRRLVEFATDIALDAIVELNKYASSRGVRLLLENLSNHKKAHPFYYTFTRLSDFEKLINTIPEVGIFFDVGHAFVHNTKYLKFFSTVIDNVEGVSLSDNTGDYDSHAPLGKGNVDFVSIAKIMTESRWKGLIAFETRGSELADDLAYFESCLSVSS